jgi:hypothetical protein
MRAGDEPACNLLGIHPSAVWGQRRRAGPRSSNPSSVRPASGRSAAHRRRSLPRPRLVPIGCCRSEPSTVAARTRRVRAAPPRRRSRRVPPGLRRGTGSRVRSGSGRGRLAPGATRLRSTGLRSGRRNRRGERVAEAKSGPGGSSRPWAGRGRDDSRTAIRRRPPRRRWFPPGACLLSTLFQVKGSQRRRGASPSGRTAALGPPWLNQ